MDTAKSKRSKGPRSKSESKQRAGSAGAMLVVGVGASAGGLEAFIELLKHLPTDTGMGFVLVQHLDPVHESALTQILTRATSMPVLEVRNNQRVAPNHIHTIPPNASMSIVNGILKLSKRESPRTPHRSIDSFFESLAADQGERAIGIVLSGTASDGTLGLQAIKAEGGFTFAQDESAKYDSMPRNAIAAGCVDLVLSPRNIAKELARMSRHPYVVNGGGQPSGALQAEIERESDQHGGPGVPLASGGHGTPRTGSKVSRAEAAAKEPPQSSEENGFKKVLALLRRHCGIDFSLYKSSTIRRRIARRVVLNDHESLELYVGFLKGNTKELDALYSDVLISVTSFFRNPEAFKALKTAVFPKILEQRGRGAAMRVWTLGCSTGQEAYSIAISYAEFSDKYSSVPKLQIFATDLNDALLEKARQGLYSKALAQDISPERLRRFFVEEEGGYRITKQLREQVVFARQNVITDPPFSRMDLISCRNLLIYLEAELQKSIVPAFHYALRSGGFLMLGASESIGPFNDLFLSVDHKHRIFSKKPAATPGFRLPLPEHRASQVPEYRIPTAILRERGDSRGPAESTRREFDAQREADRALLNLFAPPSVLVNSDLQILQFRGPTSPYLEPPTGKATFDVLKMAREGLMMPLRAVLDTARRQNKPVRKEGVRVQQHSGPPRRVNLHVLPLKNLHESCYLILFEPPNRSVTERKAVVGVEKPLGKRQESRRIAELEREIGETRGYLQSMQEDHEAANEELQASGEEIQSANEELQSINEELETSKEELESTNEELTTVNDEMVNRNAELSRSNADLTNLQLSMNIALLLFSRHLTLRRFTPQAEQLFSLVASDVGRSISGIRHNLDVQDLGQMLEDVIASHAVHERDVRAKDGRWYLMRARPYMTAENTIDGVVLVFNDITDRKHGENASGRLAAIVDSSADSIVSTDLEGTIATWNQGAERLFGYSAKEALGKSIGLIIPSGRQDEVASILERVAQGELITQFETVRRRKDESLVDVSLTVSPVRNAEGEVMGVSKVDRDITQQKQAMRDREESLKREQVARDEAEAANHAKDLFLATLSHEVRTPLNAILGWSTIIRSGTASPDDIRVGMEVIDRNCRVQARLIDDILDVSSIISGRVRIEVQPTNLSTVIQGAVDTVRPEVMAREIELSIDIDPATTDLACDAARIQQAISNLLTNAVKFTPPGGKVAVTSKRDRDNILIAVTDTGKGISSEFLPFLFEPFHQADTSIHSLGLGLSIVKHIVELHGGTVEAFSAGEERGSTFTLSLPIRSIPGGDGRPQRMDESAQRSSDPRDRTLTARSALPLDAPTPSSIRLDGVQAVVVDDEEDARRLLKRVLEGAGAQVVTCSSGAEALQTLENEPTTLSRVLISDVHMPEMDGLELIRNIRLSREQQSLPTVALTAFAQSGDREKALAAGYQVHLSKPIDPFDLIGVIAALSQKEYRRP